jgi:hypothetical protein
MKFFEYIQKFLPDVLDLIRFILDLNDHEFESISQSWPAPIKTKLAKMRFEAKLVKEFPIEGEES